MIETWDPARARVASNADEFCRLACLTYDEGDEPERWAAARELLAKEPELVADHIWAAAAANDAQAVRRLLATDPELARMPGGPYGWRPLYYLAYSRAGSDAAVEAASALLEAGADPDEGYLWRGLIPPFTLLTGVFGGGERSQPVHPQAAELARLLLAAGADPNDGQALYNRMFSPADDHLEILFAAGLGSGGRWRELLGERADTPTEMLRKLLWWAVSHGQSERVALLLRNGVDASFRFPDGRTPAEFALLNGYPEIAAQLASQPGPRDDVDAYVGAVLTTNSAYLDDLERREPNLREQVRAARPGLIVWAAGSGRPDAVALLIERGFDVNAMGRADAPIDQPWETALHVAAGEGDLALAWLLLAAGADPTVPDARFQSTPLGWAEHFERPELVELLRA